ncbi:MAG: anthranilate phosphoribosyltransferase [Chloroflexi bacterium]|jgi:anthranilate phosphoribosyltransferase|uniref:Anthranilate phosphoribosyltransferase n=1 Tax=Candidatus Thermofonsia Clade 3 bacterium TaxID=2364212 RepID=A0A2M8QET8_9CHLR|nr:anthranilate phosphoribosyltransferase [Candidatus Roseilinea sp. NK_OTU-006]PJF48314.1 MAG: anthranilate phosphoribosyltransferase [Candidatus Thermofonsia Clade 3 bacterium]RMG62669.1 MAG: anthranilate phosphoribosyltransferase [Chloroflexota bacterium]
MIQQAIAKLFTHTSLTAEEAEEAMNDIMRGAATPAQIGAYLAALHMKGESADEIVGSMRALRAHMARIPTHQPRLIDVVGTGGDRSNTFNISTTAAFVVAGAGVPVAKHGNRAASSQSGSADVLHALGVKVDLTPEQVGRCIDEIGIGFAFAPVHHPAMKNVAGARREIGQRTLFNIIGPATNPALARHHLLGVWDWRYVRLMADVLVQLEDAHALVVSGSSPQVTGIDELTTVGPNRVAEVRDGRVTEYPLDALDYGFKPATLDDLGGGSPDFNAAITRAILSGEDVQARCDVVLLNAGAALYAADAAPDIATGIEMARESIRSGAALKKLEALIALSQKLGGDSSVASR